MSPLSRIAALFLSRSTVDFYRAGRKLSGYGVKDFIHGYIYGRWTYLYISIGKGDHFLTRFLKPVWRIFFREKGPERVAHSTVTASNTAADGYHGKALPTEQARRLVTLDQPVNIPDLEKVVPYVRARALVQENPDHLALLDCPCRSSQPDPCLPLDVCLIIGEPFVGFVVEHHPRRSRRISQTEAEAVLKTAADKGYVHHAFFKDAMLGGFYAICNCCSCCCGAIKAHLRGTPMLASSGYLATSDPELCQGCGKCAKCCQFGAIAITDGTAMVDFDRCMGCGVCVGKCEKQAMDLRLSPDKGEPLEVHCLTCS